MGLSGRRDSLLGVLGKGLETLASVDDYRSGGLWNPRVEHASMAKVVRFLVQSFLYRCLVFRVGRHLLFVSRLVSDWRFSNQLQFCFRPGSSADVFWDLRFADDWLYGSKNERSSARVVDALRYMARHLRRRWRFHLQCRDIRALDCSQSSEPKRSCMAQRNPVGNGRELGWHRHGRAACGEQRQDERAGRYHEFPETGAAR